MPDTLTIETVKGHVCPHQISFMLDNWFRRLIQHPKKIAGEYIKNGDTVFDMGCGPGYFSIDLAKMVGETGKVFAVDLQESMLIKVKKKAIRHGMSDRMEFHQCNASHIGLNQKADFILAYYMIHETPDPKAFLSELRNILKPGGRILVVEPKMHVSQSAFESMVKDAESAGLHAIDFPPKKGGRSVLFGI
jgi:ubiquinone/menaquinone biosynthesis C-methylase UbiE